MTHYAFKNPPLYVVIGIHIQNPLIKLALIDNDRARTLSGF